MQSRRFGWQKLDAVSIGTRTIPVRTAVSTVRFKAVSGVSAGTRTAPAREGVGSVSLRLLRHASAGQAMPPGIYGTERNHPCRCSSAEAAASYTLPVRSGFGVIRWQPLGLTADGLVVLPTRDAVSDVTLPRLSQAATGRTIVPGAITIIGEVFLEAVAPGPVTLIGQSAPHVYLVADQIGQAAPHVYLESELLVVSQ